MTDASIAKSSMNQKRRKSLQGLIDSFKLKYMYSIVQQTWPRILMLSDNAAEHNFVLQISVKNYTIIRARTPQILIKKYLQFRNIQ